jgi:hypothetical protein
MDITKETDDSLLGMYEIHHSGSNLAADISRELMKRGYTPKTEPFTYADGSRGYAPVVYKDGKRVL